MTIVLRDQPVASTALDGHGEQLSEEDLRTLFDTMPSGRPLYDNHDYLKPPVGWVSNCRLDRLSDGGLAIVCDITVFEDKLADHWRGMSLSFHRQEPGSEEAPAPLAISFNPRSVARADMEAVQAEFGADQVALIERPEKALELAVLAAIYIVSHGFFEEAGADVYRLWKAMIRKVLEHDRPPTVAIEAPASEGRPEFLLIPSPSVELEELVLIDADGIIEQAKDLAPGNEIIKVVARVSDNGFAYLDHAVDAEGVTIRPPS